METRQIEYYRKREIVSRKRAASAADDCARHVHLDLAARYSAIADRSDVRELEDAF